MALSRVSAIFANRHCVFLPCALLSCLIFWTPLKSLITLAVADERYTHIIVIPVIGAGLLYFENKNSFTYRAYRPDIGVPLVLLGLDLLLVFTLWPVLFADLSVPIAGLVVVWIGLFVSCYGIKALRHAGAPLLLLFLIVPIPSVVLDKVVAALQAGSTEMSYGLFRLVGVPVFRHDAMMLLPGVDIEVAPQCSGIRSTMALFISSVLLGEILLRSGWGKVLVILCVGPIGIFRNAVRIVTLTLLAVHVNKDFLFGNLHRRGGLAFSVVGFAILIPIVGLVRGCERRLWSCQSGRLSASRGRGVMDRGLEQPDRGPGCKESRG
jgi:exosortase